LRYINALCTDVFKDFLMRNWTTKEIFTLKRALQRGLRPDEIAQLLPRHSVRGIIARTRKQQDSKSLPSQTEIPEFLSDTIAVVPGLHRA
jgi:hypothetical protein